MVLEAELARWSEGREGVTTQYDSSSHILMIFWVVTTVPLRGHWKEVTSVLQKFTTKERPQCFRASNPKRPYYLE